MKVIPESILLRKEEFLSKIKIVESGCWEWQGTRSKNYGNFSHSPVYRAHRVAYYIFKGVEPGKYLVCHKCDNPPCVNPEHLFLGTTQDNTKDLWSKGRNYKWSPFEKATVITEELFIKCKSEYESSSIPLRRVALNNGLMPSYLLTVFRNHNVHIRLHGKKLGEAEVVELRKLRSEGVSCQNVASIFGLHPIAVSEIYTGRRWGHFRTAYDPPHFHGSVLETSTGDLK